MGRIYVDPNSWMHYAYNPDTQQFTLDGETMARPPLAGNGDENNHQYAFAYTYYMYAQTAPTALLSHREVLFLKAEALCRLGRSEEAAEVVKEGIEEAFANTERSIKAAAQAPAVLAYGGVEDISSDGALTKADADAYFETSVLPLFRANPLKETMIQKYLAMWGANGESTETYNDLRRLKALGENLVPLANPKNAKQFPLRYTYGSDDTTANPNVQAAFGDGSYVYTEPVWWAGGSR